MKSTRRGLLLAGILICCNQSASRSFAQAPPPIRVSDNHRFLVTQDGKPFLLPGRYLVGSVPYDP